MGNLRLARILTGWSSKEAAALAGVPWETLRSWVKRGDINPSISHGKGRGLGYRWTDTDVIALRMIAALRENGVSFHRLRPMLKKLRKAALQRHPVMLVGERVYVIEDQSQLFDILSGQQAMQPVLCPRLEDVLQQIRKRAEKDEALKQRFDALPPTSQLRAA